MRFTENGPALPDELLLARDEGRVVFFCGAGVSRAKAKLPDFFGLARAVIKKLRASPDSEALKMLHAARNIERQSGLSGLLSADRIFSKLENEFSLQQIEAAVAAALKPKKNADPSAHRILLDLATTPYGTLQLVTTNFDRLFEHDSNRPLDIWQPPRLPEPARSAEMNGLVYLHGRVTPDYTGAERGGFILSSAEFGRAYLADGWATTFFRELIQHYTVIFIGYAADDPPVHYLLEALNRSPARRQPIYAFQSGSPDHARAKWEHKGVNALSYPAGHHHQALWQTLQHWAERARAPETWTERRLEHARQGPAHCLPHERGQIAHLVSTTKGAKQFAACTPPQPPEWLYVFDAQQRYVQSHAFEHHRLDTDLPADNPPANAWDAFAPNPFDRHETHHLPALRGPQAARPASLPPRLKHLTDWIGKIACHPATVWWAARQRTLHPEVQQQIQRQLERTSSSAFPVTVREAWRYLIEYWQQPPPQTDWQTFSRKIRTEGWNRRTLRNYAACTRPYLIVDEAGDRPPPYSLIEAPRLNHLISCHLVCPQPRPAPQIPDTELAALVAILRQHLESALTLATEIESAQPNIVFLLPPATPLLLSGLPASIHYFATLFERLLAFDPTAAQQEFSRWPLEDHYSLFPQLRLWAAHNAVLLPASGFSAFITTFSPQIFWWRLKEETIALLASRWPRLDDETRLAIENRVLAGPPFLTPEADPDNAKKRAAATLDFLTRLAGEGCTFLFDLEKERAALHTLAPDWRPRQQTTPPDSIYAESQYQRLRSLPYDAILAELSLAPHPDIRTALYTRLCTHHPVSAFSALRSAPSAPVPAWAWTIFLSVTARAPSKPRLLALIAEHLARSPAATLLLLLKPPAYPPTQWFQHTSAALAARYPKSFRRLSDTLIRILKEAPLNVIAPTVQPHAAAEWNTQSPPSPVASMALALFNDPRIQNAEKRRQPIPARWFSDARTLLQLPDAARRAALTCFARRLKWCYAHNPAWSEKNLLAVLDDPGTDDQAAFWNGFWEDENLPIEYPLYQRLKPHLLEYVKHSADKNKDPWRQMILIHTLFSVWTQTVSGHTPPDLSHAELREALLHTDDVFRAAFLSELIRRFETEKARHSDLRTPLLSVFLTEVWPLQKQANPPALTPYLCQLIGLDENAFPTLAEHVLPLLKSISDTSTLSWALCPLRLHTRRHPHPTLNVLHRILPPEATHWSDEAGDLLTKIAAADARLTKEENYIELKQKWDAC